MRLDFGLFHTFTGNNPKFTTLMKHTFLPVLLVIFLLSCNNSDPKSGVAENHDPFSQSLSETQIGKGNFYISIPADYFIRETEGPDFFVYYIAPKDTTIRPSYYGGIYFGNHPNNFEADNTGCKTESIDGNLFGNPIKWTSINCEGDYTIQTIADNKGHDDWNEKIHLFGGAESKEELKKVLAIFETLKKK